MLRELGRIVARYGFLGHFQDLRREDHFGHAGLARGSFDDVPIHVARQEVHAQVHPRRIPAEDAFDRTDRFDERFPVQRIEQPQAADAVADGHLVGRLLALRSLYELIAGEA